MAKLTLTIEVDDTDQTVLKNDLLDIEFPVSESNPAGTSILINFLGFNVIFDFYFFVTFIATKTITFNQNVY